MISPFPPNFFENLQDVVFRALFFIQHVDLTLTQLGSELLMLRKVVQNILRRLDQSRLDSVCDFIWDTVLPFLELDHKHLVFRR